MQIANILLMQFRKCKDFSLLYISLSLVSLGFGLFDNVKIVWRYI